MTLPKSLTTVTTCSKILALILFVTLPFLGFYLGMEYEKAVTPVPTVSETANVNTTPKPTTNPTTNWKIYADTTYGFSLKYPHTLEPFFEHPKSVLFVPEKDFWAGTDMWSVDTYGTQMNINVMDFDTVLFDDYYNHPNNSLIEKYGNRKLTNRMIGRYRVVDYESIPDSEDIKQYKEVMESGGSVSMLYYRKGLLINKDDTIIEISTNHYKEDFKKTFDQILSTFKLSE